MDFSEVEKHYYQWLHFDNDPLLVRALYSLVLANRWDSDPVWALVIGPAGSGKTELLTSLTGSDTTVFVSTLTPTALASGYGDGSDSLLFQLDDNILIVEDMSAVTELSKDVRGQLFSFLRSAYNGKFTRATGRGKIEWEGKFGFLGGATLAIESMRRMESSLGERFLYLRPRVNMENQDKLLELVIKTATQKGRMRGNLKNVAGAFLAQDVDTTQRSLSQSTLEIAKGAAITLSRVRTGSTRDSYTRNIDFPLEVGEMGTRLLGQFLTIALAAKALGSSAEQAEDIICRILLDSMPYVRGRILRCIHQGGNTPKDITANLKMHSTGVARHIEDLKHLNVINPNKRREYEITNEVVMHALDRE